MSNTLSSPEGVAKQLAKELDLYPKTEAEVEKERIEGMQYLSTLAVGLRDGGIKDVGKAVLDIFNCEEAHQDIVNQTVGVNLLYEVTKHAYDDESPWTNECREAIRAVRGPLSEFTRENMRYACRAPEMYGKTSRHNPK